MPTPTYSPHTLNFFSSSAVTSATVRVTDFSSPCEVTAWVVGDHSDCPFQLVSMTTYTAPSGSGSGKDVPTTGTGSEGGGDKLAESDGMTPLKVEPGIELDVEVRAIPSATHTPKFDFTGSLAIRGGGWLLSIPLHLVEGRVQTHRTAGSTPVLRQGSMVSVPLQVANYGPETYVSYRMPGGPYGVTLAPTPTLVDVPAAHYSALPHLKTPVVPGTATAAIQLQADATTAPGNYAVQLHESAYDGLQSDAVAPFPIQVEYGLVTIYQLATHITASMGDTVDLDIGIGLGGEGTDVVLQPLSLPPGISLDPVTFTLAIAEGPLTHTLRLQISPKMLPATDRIQVSWTAYKGEQSGLLEWTLDIKEVRHTWTYPDQTDGDVTASKIQLVCGSTGWWRLTAHMHDSSTFYGDHYELGWGFLQADSPVQLIIGELGAKYSGPPVNQDINFTKSLTYIADNWQRLFTGDAYFALNSSGQIGQILDSLASDFKTLFGSHGDTPVVPVISGCFDADGGPAPCPDASSG